MDLRATPNQLLKHYPTVNVPEAMAILGVSRITVYRLINEERVRTVKIGKRLFIPTEDLRTYLEGSVVSSNQDDASEEKT